MKAKKNIALGLMSGTSGDGVSIAAIIPRPFSIIAHKTYPYPAGLQQRILEAYKLPAAEISRLGYALGAEFARAALRFCREFKIPAGSVRVIGSHGQTVCHSPQAKPPNTLQIGEASFIGEALGVDVVQDFRAADIAAGGCGAPLIPFFDEYLYGGGHCVLLQNIGGIANISVAGLGIKTFGFDTGPGNSLMDTAAQLASRGRLRCDTDGRLAAAGKPDLRLVKIFLDAPYFRLRPPKSLDRGSYGRRFIEKYWPRLGNNNLKGVLATLNYFTAASIALAARGLIRSGLRPVEMIVSGGGALNPVLMKNLAAQLAPLKVVSSAERGMPVLAKEPACFALMAWLAVNKKINNSPRASGARGGRVLGKISYYGGGALL